MKIITEGKEWTKRLTCKGCKSVLEIDVKDLGYNLSEIDLASQQYQDEIEGSYFVSCPKCSLDLTIKKTDIPNSIKELLKK